MAQLKKIKNGLQRGKEERWGQYSSHAIIGSSLIITSRERERERERRGGGHGVMGLVLNESKTFQI